LEEIILKHGAPREIITDRGRNFISQIIKEINELCGIRHLFTTAYHPQTNGLTERFNKTLANMLSMYVNEEQNNWDIILPYVTFAYNTARQESTGFSPFYLTYGREAATTLESVLPSQPEEKYNTYDDYVNHLVTRAEDARQLARLHLMESQSKDKGIYDKKHRPVNYQVGQLVWIFTPIRRVGLSEKLLKRFFGPYRITRKISEVNYEIEPVDQGRRRHKKEVVHVLRMKPYNDPDSQENLDSE
jgi:hypothetical protein